MIPPYSRMNIAQKQAHQREVMREPSVVCPVCETQTTAVYLIKHVTRCTGPREPNRHSKWVSWRDAMRMGVPRETMSRWVKRGLVRVRGELQDREYLLRDIALRVAARRQQRRQSHKWECPGG